MSARCVVDAVQVSKLENTVRASFFVISLVRTWRAMTEENSAAAKSLTINTNGFARKKVSARAMSGSFVNSATNRRSTA
jgi:hypothetical protein